MAKRGTPVKSPNRPSVWRRGLVLAAFTLTSGVCMIWLAARDWVLINRPVQISLLPDAELAPYLRELVQQGQAELARVIEALGADRDALQLAAARTLHEEIDRCASASTHNADSQLDAIARTLATHAPQFNTAALANAAALAECILAAPLRAKTNSDRLRHCHVVLKEEAERRMKKQALSPAGASKSASISHDRATRAEPPSPTAIAVTLAPLAGGGLVAPPKDTQPRALPPQATSQAKPLRSPRIVSSIAASPSPMNLPSGVQAGASPVSHTSDDTTIAAASRHTAPADANRGNSQNQGASAVQSSSTGQVTPPMPRDLARLLELADRIRFGSVTQAAATKAELLSLGIDEAQLRLARGAVDDNPRVRQEAVEALAHVRTVDARGWLLWLSHDRDAEVRRAAITLMATAGDLNLRKRVRQAAENDADPRVRQQARAAFAPDEARR